MFVWFFYFRPVQELGVHNLNSPFLTIDFKEPYFG